MPDILDTQLDGIFATRDRDNMRPTIDALLALYEQHSENPRVIYELGGAYDTAGEEATALGFYEQAMQKGLAGDIRRRCYLQYGSTLRNLGRIEESLHVFVRARGEFPDSVALGAFESLTFHAAGQLNTALASLLNLLANHVDAAELERYKPALRGNAEYLASLDAEPASTPRHTIDPETLAKLLPSHS
jgi:tetratricopeptide (TPR) repeat protein